MLRAARAIGFSGFAELKLEIARARGTSSFFAPPATLASDASSRDVLETSIRTATEALSALGCALNTDALDATVDALHRADQVLAYGAGPSATVAADAIFRLRGSRLAQLVVVDSLAAALVIRHPERREHSEYAGIDLPDIF